MRIKAHMFIFDKKTYNYCTNKLNNIISSGNLNCIYSVSQQVQGKLYVKY